jgi:hypothetical protein
LLNCYHLLKLDPQLVGGGRLSDIDP